MSTDPDSSRVTPRRDTGRSRPRGYAAWAPRPETARVIEQVQEIIDEYRDHLPLTVRQIFYRLVGAHDYPKDERAYKRLGEYMVRARRARMVPFEAIRDDGIESWAAPFFASTADFWDDVANKARRYRRDRQVGQRRHIELWSEAGGMVPQLANAVAEYSVPVFSAGGFVSVTASRQVADRALRRDVPTLLIHVGDFDPSGESIFNALVDDAAAFVNDDRLIFTQRIDAVRVALTGEQVAVYNLPTAPAKASDTRSRNWSGETCQLEALPPDVIAGIVREAIRRELDPDRLAHQVAAEDDERNALLRALPEGTPE